MPRERCRSWGSPCRKDCSHWSLAWPQASAHFQVWKKWFFDCQVPEGLEGRYHGVTLLAKFLQVVISGSG